MDIKSITSGELMYEADIQFTGMVEYGFSMEAFTSGKSRLPLEGARFDQTFVGELRGSRLSGKMVGTDYLSVRADGLFQLHLHACVTTQDGSNISFSSTGISIHAENEEHTQLRAAISLFTSAEKYKWVNFLQLWAVGTLDTMQGKALIKAYSV